MDRKLHFECDFGLSHRYAKIIAPGKAVKKEVRRSSPSAFNNSGLQIMYNNAFLIFITLEQGAANLLVKI